MGTEFDIYVLIPQNTISINHPDTGTQWDIETYFSYIFINIAVYVLQLTKTVVPSKIFAILCSNVSILDIKHIFVNLSILELFPLISMKFYGTFQYFFSYQKKRYKIRFALYKG